jgi:hypothetical protein
MAGLLVRYEAFIDRRIGELRGLTSVFVRPGDVAIRRSYLRGVCGIF